MVRSARVKSESNIYHIMIRGINRQLIAVDEEDNQKMKEILEQCKEICGYELYGYCFLGNHIHLLMKEGKESLEQIFKRIGSRYVYYFNQKYKRIGHLFQDRFKSEPIDDEGYLITVLSYIHNNPVKAGLSKTAAEYKWSSYEEYLKRSVLINATFILGMITKEQFIELHKEENQVNVLDIGEKSFRTTDREALEKVKEICGKNAWDIKDIEETSRDLCIRKLRKEGISIRQISRITGISKGIIERVK